jgi:hypothetical protein
MAGQALRQNKFRWRVDGPDDNTGWLADTNVNPTWTEDHVDVILILRYSFWYYTGSGSYNVCPQLQASYDGGSYVVIPVTDTGSPQIRCITSASIPDNTSLTTKRLETGGYQAGREVGTLNTGSSHMVSMPAGYYIEYEFPVKIPSGRTLPGKVFNFKATKYISTLCDQYQAEIASFTYNGPPPPSGMGGDVNRRFGVSAIRIGL